MYNTTSKKSTPSFNNKKYNAAIQKVLQVSEKDGEKLSPVDISINDAVPIQLPPLNWFHYKATPSSMTVRNSGFTVMITGNFGQETPYVNSGPLLGNYVFSQIHFHWGEHNETGSGHAVDGVRYPLEMHVVHLKKDCANLGEAFKSKDGIAVMVHLFALREERNTQLDQLTAVLQFIHKTKCCARLYPTPLSEIVHPFTNDYFLYWGAVGSPKGQYRILWLVSRNVLPVSAQQMEEFRQLRDPQGKILASNSSKPQPLSGRSLFLVSPSERIDETMYGISRQYTQSTDTIDSQDSYDIGNAEYKSLAALDDVEFANCRLCPASKCLKQIANINVGYPFKVNEGDTSIEESCIDLGNGADDDGVTVKTEMKYKDNIKGQRLITNVNVTACRHKCNTHYSPSEAVYSVISARGSELHLKRKPLLVRQNDPSTEQACMMLSRNSSAHPTYSAPSLSTKPGYFNFKEEPTASLSPPVTNLSSELAIYNRDSECVPIKETGNKSLDNERKFPPVYSSYINEQERETIVKEVKTAKKVRMQNFEDNTNSQDYTEPTQISKPDTPYQESSKIVGIPKQNIRKYENHPSSRSREYDEYYAEEKQNFSCNERQNKYLVVKRTHNKKPFYKVVGELPCDPGVNNDSRNFDKNASVKNNSLDENRPIQYQPIKEEILVNRNSNNHQKQLMKNEKDLACKENNTNNLTYEEIYQGKVHSEQENRKETHTEMLFKKGGPYPATSTSKKPEIPEKNKLKQNKTQLYSLKERNPDPYNDQELKSDPHYRVSLFVRTTVSDHRKPGKRKGGSAKQYVVTKISPVEKSLYITPKASDQQIKQYQGKKLANVETEHLYYAKPLNEDIQRDPAKGTQKLAKHKKKYDDLHNPGYTSELYERSYEQLYNEQKVEEHLIIKKTESDHKISQGHVSENSLNEAKLRGGNICKKFNRKQPQESQIMNLDVTNDTTRSDGKLQESVVNEIQNVSTTVHEEITKDTNLLHQINIYHGKKEPDGEIHIVDKKTTGKIGETQSTDVLLESKNINIITPQKEDDINEINYNLVKSKHPAPQYYVKIPPNETQPAAIIRQSLSLDQQIKGHSHVQQTVEYHDNRKIKKNDENVSDYPQSENYNRDKDKFSSVTERYEESTQDQSSSYKRSQKTHVQFQPNTQNLGKELPNKPPQYIENNTNDCRKTSDPTLVEPAETYASEKNDSSQFIGISITKTLNNDQLQSAVSKPEKSIIVDNSKTGLNLAASQNIGYNSYEYEETNSINKVEEYSKYKKINRYDKQNVISPSIGHTIQDSFPMKQPIPAIADDKGMTKSQQMKKFNEKSAIDYDPAAYISNNDYEKRSQNEDEDNGGVEFEEILEENTVYTSQKTKESRMARKIGDTSLKFPNQATREYNEPSQHAFIINKTEIPEPHYITRVPKQPLVEYEAYPVDPHQPFEIMTETSEETTSVTKTHKTFMMFKRINGKAVLNQPSIIEPMKLKLSNNDKLQYIDNISKISSIDSSNKGGLRPYNTNKYINEQAQLYEHLSEEEKRIVKQKNKIKVHERLNDFKEKPQMIKDTIAQGQHLGEEPILPTEENLDPGIKVLAVNPNNNTGLSSANNERIFKEYEYSETSLVSERKLIQKEKKYKYKVHQQPVFEEDYKKLLPGEPNLSLKAENTFPEQSTPYTPQIMNSLTQINNQQKEQTENRTKIIVGSYQQNKSLLDQPQLTTSTSTRESGEQNAKTIQPFFNGNISSIPGNYVNSEYYESVKKDEKYESSKKHFVSFKEYPTLAEKSDSPSPVQYTQPYYEKSNNYKVNEPKYHRPKYDPTRDPTRDIPIPELNERNIELNIESSSENIQSNTTKLQMYKQKYSNEKGYTPKEEKLSQLNTEPIPKTDGDIVIYIRQPKTGQQEQSISPKITVDVSNIHSMTPSELEAQKVQVHGLQPNQVNTNADRKPILPRKSKSEGYYRKKVMDSTDTSGETTEDNLNCESNYEQVIDTTQYNFTLKSETQVEFHDHDLMGQDTQVKSKAEVTLKPLLRPGTPYKPVAAQETMLECEECCSESAMKDIYRETNYSNQSTSYEESTETDESGFNQSPIKIDTRSTVIKRFTNLQFHNHWNASGDALLENNGKTLRASFLPGITLPYIKGGPLQDEYIFSELHFHWGQKDCCGAEHIIDGNRNTLEAHYLYFRKDYGSFKEAMLHRDGLAVVAVNLTVGGPPNRQLGELLKDMPLLREADTGTYVSAESIFTWIKPTIDNAKGYFSYRGSLSPEPPHVESVTWMIFPEPIVFCCQQSCEFRKLKTPKGELLQKNYRPPQPRNNRPVYYVPV